MNTSSLPCNFEQDFERLVASFEAISAIGSRFKQQFHLSQVASYHGIPRAEFRRLYTIWLAEKTQEAIGGEELQ